MAEQQTCHSSWFLTLTYGGGYENTDAYWINYRDVQLMFKKLRKAGHKFKYVAVGEHGTQADRAHFHILMFWQTPPPDGVQFDTNYQWDYWTNGHSNIQKPKSQQACAVYIMDYVNKDNLKRAVMKFSVNPMLGQEYLLQYARDHVNNGVSLFADSDRFTVPNNTSQSGKPFYYPVGRETGIYKKMLDTYISEWATNRPEQPIPLSEDLTDYMSDLAQDTSEQPRHVQQFFSRHYGVEPVQTLDFETQTVHSIKNINLTHQANYVLGEVFNREGKTIWAGHVTNVENDPQQGLNETQLLNALNALKNKLPPHVLKYLSVNPSENTMPTDSDPPLKQSQAQSLQRSKVDRRTATSLPHT